MAADKKFVKDAIEGSIGQVELGKLAQEKGSSEAVKEFGQKMVADHSKVTKQLEKIGTQVGASTELPRKAKKAKEKLSKLSGAEFDREYAKYVMSDSKDDVKMFERQARDGKVPDLKEFAANLLPTIQEHQKMAEQLEASTKTQTASNR